MKYLPMLSEGSHSMKMCLKLAYYAFHCLLQKMLRWVPFGVFLLHYLLKFKTLDDFFPSKMWLQISLRLWLECVCVHPLIKDVFQATFDTFYQCHFQKMIGLVAFKFSLLFMLKFKSFKMWRPVSPFILLRLLLCVWKVIPYRKGMSWGICSL